MHLSCHEPSGQKFLSLLSCLPRPFERFDFTAASCQWPRAEKAGTLFLLMNDHNKGFR